MKTVRFRQVIAQSGQPEPYTLWVAPKDDRTFQTAVRQNRVMTVHQETVGAKKDFGEVGFLEGVQGSLLVFPKALKGFEGKRVVGIDYDLLATPPEGKAAPAAPEPKQEKRPEAPPPIPNFRIFRAEEEEEEQVAPPKKAGKQESRKAGGAPPSKQTGPSAKKRTVVKTDAEPAAQSDGTPAAEQVPKPSSTAALNAKDADSAGALTKLTAEVRRAMKQLRAGKTVAAYQTLEKALSTP